MRPARHLLLAGVAASLVLGATSHLGAAPAQLGGSTGQSSVGSQDQLQLVAKRKRARNIIQPFSRRTVRAVRGNNKITVTWPARANATGYTVTWTPYNKAMPSSPARCVSPCKRRFTRGTSMALSATDLTTYGRLVGSTSGNYTRFKVFSHRGTLLRWTGTTYPYDAWVGPSFAANTAWVPGAHAQLPLPLPPEQGLRTAVTSFNVLSASATGVPSWSTRAPRIVNQFNSAGSSIVATQENSNSANGVASGRSQYMDLAARLGSAWTLADDRNWDRASNPNQASSRSSQATRIYYRSANWSKVSSGALMTHALIAGQTSGVNVDRWVSWVRLRSAQDTSKQVCVINAHLITNLGTYDRASADHRNTEIAQILSELNNPDSTERRVGTRVGAACAGVPTIFTGDLNAAQAHAPYGNQPQATMIRNGFVDTKNAGTTVYTKFSGPGSIYRWHDTWGTQIDYILARGVGGAVSFKVNAVTPSGAGSDHYPITAVVNVP